MENEFERKEIFIKNGELVHADGTSAVKYLKEWSERFQLSSDEPLRIMTHYWYDILTGLEEFMRCNFCSKPKSESKFLLQNQLGSFICDKCVEIASELVAEKKNEIFNDLAANKALINEKPEQTTTDVGFSNGAEIVR